MTMDTNVLVFWVLISLMTIVAVLVSAWPWMRPRHASAVDRESLNAAVYRDRLAELETAMDYPTLTFDQREQERRVLAQELLDDVGDSSRPPASETHPDPKTGRWALFAIAVVLPVTALLLYSWLGTGTYLFSTTETSTAEETQGADGKMQAIEQMVTKLADRLAANPNDLRGWTMLGRSYMALERYPEAAEAYARASTLADQDLGLIADHAEALVLANGSRLNDQAQALVTKVLHEAPDHPKGLWLAGIWAFQEGRYPAAAESWRRLKSLLPEGSELIDKIGNAIDEAERRATKAAPDSVAPTIPPQAPASSATPSSATIIEFIGHPLWA
ncbi:hypothetical protein CCP3SC15_2170002 [Gammaproteobacteria bacterium]